ncbi:MAG: fumarylacetoacetate hydrolase family protein [Anaerolineae bacterium]|nr:fumarylacetoacetate hydrolase family protein [Anaerolineae bacterium]
MAENIFLVAYGERHTLGVQIGDAAYALRNGLDSLDHLLTTISAADLSQALVDATGEPINLVSGVVPPPVGNQEVWAAGVTYKRSEEARERESNNSNIYSRVYSAQRPEIFFKALGADVIGSGDTAGIRCDAKWSVPEPELVVVYNTRMEVIGFTAGNDMSSRDIEGENPLYLPQAKVYEGSCVIGPRIWVQPGRTTWPDVAIHLSIRRGGQEVFKGDTSTANLHRSLADLTEYLGRCKRFRYGAMLFTGTGIVPPDDFALAADDEVQIRIDSIGELVNRVGVVGG